ncbi:hypothetical protein GFS31_08210 [Leptolyngbya sp. BL0902]|nr:hypothetical protein GFS31_08210 [Leptolyngbya sp. BL0902]
METYSRRRNALCHLPPPPRHPSYPLKTYPVYPAPSSHPQA